MHRPTTCFTRIVLGGLGVATLAMSARPARAADRVWFDTIFGGDGIHFNDPFNWSPSGVPNAFDRAIFASIGGPVQVTASTTINALVVTNGIDMDLTIMPAGSLFANAAPGFGVQVGTDENLSRLTLDGGTLATEGAEIGVDGLGELRIGSERDVRLRARADHPADPATLILTNSASADYANNVFVANLAGRAGTLALAARASLTGDQKLLVGDDGDGEMSVLGAAIADFDGSIRVGNNAAGSGQMIVNGAISPAEGDRSRVYSRGDGVLSTVTVGLSGSGVLPSLTNAAFALVEKPGGLGEILELRVEADSPGDLDLDGFVGFTDLSDLLAGWGNCPATGACPGDLDGNGAVGFTDLAALLANWG